MQNSTEKIFQIYCRHINNEIISIKRIYPKKDISIYSDSIKLKGFITGITKKNTRYQLLVKVNGQNENINTSISESNFNFTWESLCLLPEYRNVITLSLSLDAQVLATDSVIVNNIFFTDEKPKIISIECDEGAIKDSSIVRSKNQKLKIEIKKSKYGIKKVLVNGSKATLSVDSLYIIAISLNHKKEGNNVKFFVEDYAGNTAQKEITIFQNNLPYSTYTPSFEEVLVNSSIRDSIIIKDSDNDPIVIKGYLHTPVTDTILQIDSSGYFSWQPSIKDTTDSASLIFNIGDIFENYHTKTHFFKILNNR